jgi:hypothetical protein
VSDLLELPLAGGGTVLIEAAPASVPVTRGRGGPAEAVTRAGASLEQVLGRVGPAVQGIVRELREAAEWPDEVTVEFAVKVSTDSSVIIARAGGEANFRITMMWSRAAG